MMKPTCSQLPVKSTCSQLPTKPTCSQLPIRPSWNQLFMMMAELMAQRSTCLKLKTGCVITKGTQIKAIGYNGTFPHHEECNEYWAKKYNINCKICMDIIKKEHKEWSLANEIHAEANALKWIKPINNNYILYTVYSPCDLCAKDIIAHGIKTVYYRKSYKHGYNAIERLIKAGVECYQI